MSLDVCVSTGGEGTGWEDLLKYAYCPLHPDRYRQLCRLGFVLVHESIERPAGLTTYLTITNCVNPATAADVLFLDTSVGFPFDFDAFREKHIAHLLCDLADQFPQASRVLIWVPEYEAGHLPIEQRTSGMIYAQYLQGINGVKLVGSLGRLVGGDHRELGELWGVPLKADFVLDVSTLVREVLLLLGIAFGMEPKAALEAVVAGVFGAKVSLASVAEQFADTIALAQREVAQNLSLMPPES